VTRLNSDEIRTVYDRIHTSDINEDEWHRHSSSAIGTILKQWVPNASQLLNIGSGDVRYQAIEKAIRLDISICALVRHYPVVVGDAHLLPFMDSTFDAAICVGSVINYVSVTEVLADANRVLKPNGTLIIEYERNPTLTSTAAITASETTYRGERHTYWLYSDQYIEGSLRAANFELRERRYFHVMPPAIRTISLSSHGATLRRLFDRRLQSIGQKWAANVALRCDKSG
jgi:SAM-dependent methyltransferase